MLPIGGAQLIADCDPLTESNRSIYERPLLWVNVEHLT